MTSDRDGYTGGPGRAENTGHDESHTGRPRQPESTGHDESYTGRPGQPESTGHDESYTGRPGQDRRADGNGDPADRVSVQVRDTGVKAADILRLISEGFAYDQILRSLPGLFMGDIMAVADLARQVLEALEDEHGRVELHYKINFLFTGSKPVLLENLRKEHPRAYTPWTDREDNNLVAAYKSGVSLKELVRQHGRQPGAIRARLEKLGLLSKAQ
jgi:uncharacterized protein (DUF433 family)